MPVDPDPGFSEEHNRQTVGWVIKETDRIARKNQREHQEAVGERIDAVARFIQRVKQGGGESDVKTYFGKKMLEYLSGRDKRALDDLTVVDPYGRIIRQKGGKTAHVKK